MLRRKLAVRIAFGLLVMLVIGFGVAAMVTTAEAGGPCRCPLVYAPVQCDHGKIYPNPCVAECHNAKNCVPLPL
jgi:hypothetical protein